MRMVGNIDALPSRGPLPYLNSVDAADAREGSYDHMVSKNYLRRELLSAIIPAIYGIDAGMASQRDLLPHPDVLTSNEMYWQTIYYQALGPNKVMSEVCGIAFVLQILPNKYQPLWK